MDYLDDILILAGEALIVVGASMHSLQTALYTAGVFLLIDGVALGISSGLARRGNDRQ